MSREVKKITFYTCPVCGKRSASRTETEKHFRSHTVLMDEYFFCRACGAGWPVSHWGEKEAVRKAEECYQKHVKDGNLRETATKTFFASGGTDGFPEIIKGRRKG